MEVQIETVSEWLGSGSINIFGKPFAGKDTQGQLLADTLGGHLIKGGEILRNSPKSDDVKEMMAQGILIPNDVYLGIVTPYLSLDQFASQPLVLSTVGRLKGEESVIMEATRASGHPMKAVILLEVDENKIRERFVNSSITHDRGYREDDSSFEVVEERIDQFNKGTRPVLDYYEEKGLLITIDGSVSEEEVNSSIIESLAKFALNS